MNSDLYIVEMKEKKSQKIRRNERKTGICVLQYFDTMLQSNTPKSTIRNAIFCCCYFFYSFVSDAIFIYI